MQLWKSVCSYLGKQEIEQPYDPVLSLLVIFPNNSIFSDMETFSSMSITPLFTTDDKCIIKNSKHIHNGLLFSCKKNKIMKFSGK